ncbi:hypothetical protein Tco_0627531 [Tanacetum coccineum]|uniref:Secreted protein n=1 Tax=Tanacetum coccineum TaxID=301880 RepID=A0ABQ4WMQ1_9ASTR
MRQRPMFIALVITNAIFFHPGKQIPRHEKPKKTSRARMLVGNASENAKFPEAIRMEKLEPLVRWNPMPQWQEVGYLVMAICVTCDHARVPQIKVIKDPSRF